MESPESGPFSCCAHCRAGRAGSLPVSVMPQRGGGTAVEGLWLQGLLTELSSVLQGARRTLLWVWVFVVQPLVAVSGFSCSHTAPSVLSPGAQGGWIVWCGHRDAAACGVRDAQNFATAGAAREGRVRGAARSLGSEKSSGQSVVTRCRVVEWEPLWLAWILWRDSWDGYPGGAMGSCRP